MRLAAIALAALACLACESSVSPCSRVPDVDPATGHCYVRFSSNSVHDATFDCNELWGYLIVLDGPEEQAFVLERFHIGRGDAWVNGRRSESGQWVRWYTDDPLPWTDWDAASPSADPDADCIKLYVEDGPCSTGCWTNVPCDAEVQLYTLCEIEP